jgi:hypothetical protein
MKRFFLSILVIPVLLGSCALEHRHYRSGFYIDRNENREASANAHPRAIPTKTATLAVAPPAEESIRTPEISSLPLAPTAQLVTTPPVPELRSIIRHEERRQLGLPLRHSKYDVASVKDTIYVKSNNNHPMHPQAKTAQVLGIASLVCTFFLGIGILLAPFAIGIGIHARNEILDSGNYYSGLREAESGIKLGIITIIINILIGALIIALLLFTFM